MSWSSVLELRVVLLIYFDIVPVIKTLVLNTWDFFRYLEIFKYFSATDFYTLLVVKH